MTTVTLAVAPPFELLPESPEPLSPELAPELLSPELLSPELLSPELLSPELLSPELLSPEPLSPDELPDPDELESTGVPPPPNHHCPLANVTRITLQHSRQASGPSSMQWAVVRAFSSRCRTVNDADKLPCESLGNEPSRKTIQYVFGSSSRNGYAADSPLLDPLDELPDPDDVGGGTVIASRTCCDCRVCAGRET